MKVAILNGHGFGDGLLAFQCAHYVANQISKNNIDVISCQRDEVYYPTWRLFGNLFNIKQHSQKDQWAENNWILSNTFELETYKQSNGYDEVYYIIPDLLYRNPYAFDWRKWRVHPNTIKSTRLLTNEWNPLKRIFINCVTTTQNYNYPYIDSLVRELSKALPDHEIIIPTLDNWAGKPVLGNPSDLGLYNVKLLKNITFMESVELLKRSEFLICLDSGFSHLGFQMGIPRILLDPYLLSGINSLKFQARWRSDMAESVSLNESPSVLAKIVKNNLETPQTALLTRYQSSYDVNWPQTLFFKF